MSRPREQPLRILHLIDSGGLYGAEKVLLTLAVENLALGHEVSVGTMVAPHDPGDPLGDAAIARGIEHVQFPMRDGFSIGGLRQVLEYVSDHQIQILHTHGYRANIMMACVPRRWRKCPIVTTLHGWTSVGKLGKLAVYEAVERWLLTRIDAVVIVSEAMRDRLPRRVAAADVHLIPNGIDLAHILQAKERTGRAQSDPAMLSSTPVVTAIGRLTHEKGFDVLLQATKVLHDNGLEFDLIIAGAGPEQASLLELAGKLGLSDRVKFQGYVENVIALYARTTVFAIPSRSEGLPLVLLEAMAAGVPVVATRVGQIPIVLNDGYLGFLVMPQSVTDLAQGLRDALSSRVESRKRADLASQHVQQFYSAETMSDSYVTLYQQLLRAADLSEHPGRPV